ncbi:MAG: DNA alkylation repair protein [Lachnospiraceae bacterium]|nr:DNA alkylation repair protein [Lachnospiraceae bacterium]
MPPILQKNKVTGNAERCTAEECADAKRYCAESQRLADIRRETQKPADIHSKLQNLADIHGKLQNLAEPEYAKFSASLLRKPGEEALGGSAANVMGVRLPALHKLAKKLSKQDWKEYLEAFEAAAQAAWVSVPNGQQEGLTSCAGLCFEERMLWGFLIGEVTAAQGRKDTAQCLEMSDKLRLIENFLPQIDNWSICDSFCAGLKFARLYPAQIWKFIQPLFRAKTTYVVRFAVVMCINYFISEEYVEKLFPIFDEIAHEDYYVKMAVAWAVSVCYVKFPEKTLEYLEHSQLDIFTHNKALQKIVESRCVPTETKVQIRKMKRRE